MKSFKEGTLAELDTTFGLDVLDSSPIKVLKQIITEFVESDSQEC